jgi:GT2 family glycosyltransferase
MPPPKKEKLPLVSIVTPAYNTDFTIQGMLESVVNQDYPRFEVIVTDDHSTDATAEIIRSFPQVKLISNKENKGPAAARNAALKMAKGSIIIIQDADAKVFPGWIRAHVEEQKNGHSVIAGSVIPWDNNFVGMCDHYSTWYEYHPQKRRQADRYQVSSTNLSFSREVLEKVGLFNEKLRYLEDVDFCQRIHAAGYQIGFAPGIPMAHHDRHTWMKYLRHHYRYGTIAPWVRNKEMGTRFSFLFPETPLGAFLMIIPLSIMHTGFVIANWLPSNPQVLLYAPFIYISKLAHAIGVYDGVKKKVGEKSR